MEFRKYQHIERFGTTEVEHIEVGKCYLFPKIDGTNSQVYLNESGEVCVKLKEEGCYDNFVDD